VIISSVLIQYFGWYISDPICSLFISIMIFLSVLPLLKDSAMTLLLQTSSNIQYETLDRILKVDQVLSYSDEHFWNLSSSMTVGTIHIQVTNDGDEQRITSQVRFQSFVGFLLTVFCLYLGTSYSERSSNAKCNCSSRKTSIFESFDGT
jgi:cation diffusion facilitator family transporter